MTTRLTAIALASVALLIGSGPARASDESALAAHAECSVSEGYALIGCLTKVITTDTYSPAMRAHLYGARGNAYAAASQYPLAIIDFDTAIGAAPESALLLRRGLAYSAIGDYPRAVDDYGAAIAKADLTSRGDLAVMYNARCFDRAQWGQQLNEALADCEQALSWRPNASAILDSRALVYLRLGDNAKALADCTAALAATPDTPSARYTCGIARLRQGDQSGRADLTAAQASDPTVAQVYARYGITP